MKIKIIKCERGIAAVEFALSLPFLILLFFGTFELFRSILINQKLEKLSYTVSDVVAQQSSITQSQLAQIMTAASEVMDPFPFGTNGVVIVSSVYKQGTSPPVVKWQYKGGGSLNRNSMVGPVNADATLQNGLTLNDKDNIIVSEVFYSYGPLLGDAIMSDTEAYKTAVFKPRLGVLTTAPQ